MKHLVLGLFLFTVACKQPMKEPENLDPIYIDILQGAAEARSKLSGEEKALETAKKEWEAVEPQTGQEPIKRNAYFKAQKNVRKYQQLVQYYELRAEERKMWARKSYQEAWNQEEEWPNKELAKKYKANKRLRQASRNWNARVPKLQERMSRYTSSLAPVEEKGGEKKEE